MKFVTKISGHFSRTYHVSNYHYVTLVNTLLYFFKQMYLKITIHLHSFIKPTSSFKRLCPISSNNDLHKIHHVYYMYNITSYHIYMYMFSYLYFEHLKIYMFLSFLCVHCILLIDRCPFVFQVVIGITAKILHFYSSKLIELKKTHFLI